MLYKKTIQYRLLEILPGALTWATLIGSLVFSYFAPFWVAIYIILFDLYWVLKAVNTAMHLLSSFRKLKQHGKINWLRELERLPNPVIPWREVIHLVIMPTYKESLEVLEHSIKGVLDSDFPKEQIFFVLATEERDYARAVENGKILKERYGQSFYRFEVIMHPDGIAGEIKAKGANLTYAARQAAVILRDDGVPIDNVIVSAFDSDTVVSKNYFSYLAHAFLTAQKPYRTSYQPMPVYNNNIWDAPAITRVVAVANSFWQMVEASRPDRLVTFSSHAMSLRALVEVDFWPVDVISDDSQIFWRCWLHYNGDYRTLPIFTHVSLDAMLDETYFKTLVGQYKQKRRWAWGIENFPYLVSGVKGRPIPFWKKFIYIERELEGKYFWATASIMIAGLGWLPLLFGGSRFEQTVFAVNLPLLTRLIMQIATVFLIFSVYINMVMLPPRPRKYSRWRTASMILQWVFVPIVSTIFGSLPAIDAQTRLMLGRYMEFWVTPKARKTVIKEPAMVFQSKQT